MWVFFKSENCALECDTLRDLKCSMHSIFGDIKGVFAGTLCLVSRAAAGLGAVILGQNPAVFYGLFRGLYRYVYFKGTNCALECDTQRVFKSSVHSIFGDLKGVRAGALGPVWRAVAGRDVVILGENPAVFSGRFRRLYR